MIVPPGSTGVVFTDASDGDMRADRSARQRISSSAGIPGEWATVSQVHGDEVVRASSPKNHGEADALWTDVPGLPLAVFTADCLGVVAVASSAVGVAHAGWRGASKGVVKSLVDTIESNGHSVKQVLIGPAIGPCCFEVGPEVAQRFPGSLSETRWGTMSVDLISAVREQTTAGISWVGECTRHAEGFLSHRRDQTPQRMATLAWLP